MPRPDRHGETWAIAGVAGVAVLCCGLPALAASGALAAVAGIGFGNWLLIGAGLAVLTAGLLRRRRHRRDCTVEHQPRSDRQP